MRLLQWDNGEISLTDHPTNDKLPKYAILSHTWLPDNDQEVTFQDLKSRSGKSKPGFQKIRFCGQQAIKDGLQYFWVDTCCINKSDQSEVQMSINSMFRWYQKAEKCYVFLSDVSVAEDATGNISDVDFVPAFRSSRWWTRGWTLQELLAPRSVEFFSCNHKRIGDKLSLEVLINDITKIPIRALREFGILKVDVEQCISWVLKRNTRYEEDLAYSLLGMCGVSLSLIYGEGRKRAFRRLREEAESNERDIVIQELTDRLELRHRLVLCVSKGLQTSQVTKEYNNRWRDHYPDGRLFWKNADSFGSFEQAYKDIAKELAIPGTENQPNYLILVRDWLNELANGPWLLILDNFDNPDLFFEPQVSPNAPNQPRISEFLPQNVDAFIIAQSHSEDNGQPQTGRQEAAIVIAALDSSSVEELLRSNKYILKNEQLDKTNAQLLNSLRDSNMNTRRNQIENNHAETFSWIFDPEGQRPWDSFPEWLTSDSSEIYWIQGKAGSGKSTLMKFLVEADETKTYLNLLAPGHMVYSHFIWNSGTPMQRSLKGLLCSLVHQIFDEDGKIMAKVLRKCPHISKAQNTNDWSIESLKSVLSSSLEFHQQPVCIFLDGLDEIASEQDSSELQGPYNLLDFIIDGLSSSGGNIKICVSSRPEPAFISKLQRSLKLQLQDLTKRDVEFYTRDFIRTRCSFDFEDVTEETFVDEVVRMADGVFLWVSLALQSLQRGLSSGDRPEELFNRLRKLPRRLEKLYDNMFERLGEDQDDYKQTAAMYCNIFLAMTDLGPYIRMSWRKYGNWNLLDYAIAFEPQLCKTLLEFTPHPQDVKPFLIDFERRLTSRCAGLLEVVNVSQPTPTIELSKAERPWDKKAVAFIHRSAREFLLDNRARLLDLDKTSSSEQQFNILQAHILTEKYGIQQVYTYFDLTMHCISSNKVSLPQEKELELLELNREVYRKNGWNFFFDNLARYGFPQVHSLYENECGRSSAALRNYLLLCCATKITSRTNRTVSELLRKGADPNWYGLLSIIDGTQKLCFPVPILGLFLVAFGDDFSISSSLTEDTERLELFLQLFLKSSAELERRYIFFYELENHRYYREITRPFYVNYIAKEMGFITESNCVDTILSELGKDVPVCFSKPGSKLHYTKAHRKILIVMDCGVPYEATDEDSDAINKLLGWPESLVSLGSREKRKRYPWPDRNQCGTILDMVKGKEVNDVAQWLTDRGYVVLKESDLEDISNKTPIHEMAEIYRKFNKKVGAHCSD